MNPEKPYQVYSAEDIEKYYSGNLSSVQMHAMEKAALDDPLLAEAMEGYELMKGKDWKKELVVLRKQFSEVKPFAKVIPMQKTTGNWWKAAAAILVIGCGSVITYLITKDRSTESGSKQIARNISKESNPESTTTVTIAPPKTDNSPGQTIVQPVQRSAKVIDASNKLTASQNNGLVVTDSALVFKPAKPAPVSLAKAEGKVSLNDLYKKTAPVSNSNPGITVTTNSNTIPPESPIVKAKENSIPPMVNADEEKNREKQNINTGIKSQQLNRSFTAQVFGEDNMPLPFSNISIKSENFGTYTDVKGNFRLVSSDSILSVEVRSVGYLPKTITLKSNQALNKIVLAEDEIAFSKKTVIKDRQMADKTVSRRATLLKDSVVNVEPADGWDNYNTYIANNIDLPEDISKKDIHGEIGISFDVKSNGTISNIKVDPSHCKDCEESTKRLIEQGPQWKIKKGKKASAKVKVQF